VPPPVAWATLGKIPILKTKNGFRIKPASSERSPSEGHNLAEPKDLQAVVNRLRAATETLTDPRDISIAQEYISELEAIAAEQAAEDRRGRQRAFATVQAWSPPSLAEVGAELSSSQMKCSRL